MKSARRNAYIKRKNVEKKRGGKKSILRKILIPVLIILSILLFIKITTRYWNGHDKVGIVFRQDDGSVAVSEIDPKLGEMTSIIIPGDAEVTVAKNYGVLRIKNVWRLGLNEKLNGKLLSDTVMQNFLFPVHLWSDSDAASIKNTDFLGIIRFIFLPKKTNISFGDRALIGFYAMGLKELSKTEIDLGRSQFLKKIRLSDGEQGYRIVDSTAARLGVYFSDTDLIGQKLNVYLVDATGKNGVGEKVGQIIEV